MARRTGSPRRRPTIPESNEVWEVGRRVIEVEVAELAAQGEQPEVFAALQNTPQPGMVRVDMLTSGERSTALADFVVRAIQEPHVGTPRRPAVIRVSTAAEAELLSNRLELAGITCEVATQLDMLEELYDHLLSSFGHFPHDYRAQAARVGETLSTDMLFALFRTARAFFRRELWLAYDDSALFELLIEPQHKPATKAYGTLMGSMGETFGLVLFPSLEDLRQMYERPEPPPPPPRGRGAGGGRSQQDEELQEVQDMVQAMQSPSISLTYAGEDEVPEALWAEAHALHLPLAEPQAFPVIMRTGQGRMQVASAAELVLVYVALQAILSWDRQRLDAEEDELDLTLSMSLPAVGKTTPEMHVRITLQRNPFAPEEEEEDDEDEMEMDVPPEFITFFEKLTTTASEIPPEPPSRPGSDSRPKRGKK